MLKFLQTFAIIDIYVTLAYNLYVINGGEFISTTYEKIENGQLYWIFIISIILALIAKYAIVPASSYFKMPTIDAIYFGIWIVIILFIYYSDEHEFWTKVYSKINKFSQK